MTEELHHLVLHNSYVLHNCITGHHHFIFMTTLAVWLPAVRVVSDAFLSKLRWVGY